MRITYRAHQGNREYWQQRWDDIDADSGDLNLMKYPGRYCEAALKDILPTEPVLEAGCGAGRVFLYYRDRKRNIVGMDFIHSVLHAIRERDAAAPLVGGNITQTPFADSYFGAVLAFGLYHNLQHDLEQAVRETRRILRPGGVLCASMRLDNFNNRLVDWLAGRKTATGPKGFHKINLSRQEVSDLFSRNGFSIEHMDFVENMPLLYRFQPFRHAEHKVFRENLARAEGYRLSGVGQWLQSGLGASLPSQMASVSVITARAA